MPKFREVLKNRNFLLLWLGQIISQVGDRLGFMALIGFAYSKQAQGSPTEVFKILLFTIIPVFLIGPVAGVYVDRWDRRRTLYTCDLLRMLLVLIIPVFLLRIINPFVAYFLIFIVFCLGRFFIPAKLSIVPELVNGSDLLLANSLINVTGMVAFIIGSGIGGIVVQRVGVQNGFYLDALSFLISAALIFFITKSKPNACFTLKKIGGDIVEVISKSVIEEIKEGLLYFVKNKNISLSAGILFVLSSALGMVSVVSIVFVQKVFVQTATKDLGLLIMFLGLGLFAGTLIYGRFFQRTPHYKAIFISLMLTGAMIAFFGLTLERYPYFINAAALSFLSGLFVAPIMVATNTIVHKASDNEMRGKVFSSLEVVMHLGFLLFMYLSSVLASRFSQAAILVVIGIIFSVLGIISLTLRRKIPWLN